LQKSKINRALFHSIQQIKHVNMRDLYELYPNFFIDISVEQDLLKKHDVIVMQFPVYWFSMPALLKQWVDLVLESGFAYGKDGTHLKGKKFVCIVSAGGSQEAYDDHLDRIFNLKELFAPIEQMALYCEMEYIPPYVIYDAHNQSQTDMAKHEANLYWMFDNFSNISSSIFTDQQSINSWVEHQLTETK